MQVLFISHCWCNTEVQLITQQLIAMLALNGMSYWSDFLDLKALAPMPWNWKVVEAIRDCAKVVLFVDREWLVSINSIRVRDCRHIILDRVIAYDGI